MGYKIKGGGKIYRGGSKIEGPSHNEGGVQATIDGQPVAEIEGGERMFSVEDTDEIEERVSEIVKTENSEDAAIYAQALGHRIVEMVNKQERINPS